MQVSGTTLKKLTKYCLREKQRGLVSLRCRDSSSSSNGGSSGSSGRRRSSLRLGSLNGLLTELPVVLSFSDELWDFAMV